MRAFFYGSFQSNSSFKQIFRDEHCHNDFIKRNSTTDVFEKGDMFRLFLRQLFHKTAVSDSKSGIYIHCLVSQILIMG